MKLLPAFLLLLLSTRLSAQSIVQIGAGNSSSPITNFAPVFRTSAGSANHMSRSNMLFTQEELLQAGLSAGMYLTKFEFYKTNSGSLLIPARIRMYLRNCASTSLSTSDTWNSVLSTHTQVRNDSTITIAGPPGWQEFSITPFLYMGGGLELAVEQIATPESSGATGSIAWQFTSPADASKMVGIQSNAPADVMNSISTG